MVPPRGRPADPQGKDPEGKDAHGKNSPDEDPPAENALADYRRKRDFDRTAEPTGADRRRSATHRFVVQQHWARRLHFDFRLELDGVLKSWAVPKGPSSDPRDRRMAVPTEDHPVEYATFEGEIPAGAYGAGRVEIWDHGDWTPVGDPRAGLADGHLKFDLHGQRLQGRWALVRMKPREHERRSAWLLIKDKDRHATAGSAVPAAGTGARRAPAKPAPIAPPPSSPMPSSLAPQLATLVGEPPTPSTEWRYELKFDGYRLLARIEHGTARLFTRNGLDWTAKLPMIAAALEKKSPADAWLDGELVVPNAQGLPDFGALQQALADSTPRGWVYYLFDAPFMEGRDLRDQPLQTRRDALERWLRGRTSTKGPIRLSAILDHPTGDLLSSVCAMGIEGLIGKRLGSGYRSGRSADWIKLKCGLRQAFVVIGYTRGNGRRDALGALALAIQEPGGLRYVGNVGSGIDAATFARLKSALTGLHSKSPPALTGTARPTRVQWVRPELVVEVSFGGWTAGRRLRHGVFRGLRPDKPAAEVGLERPTRRVAAAAATTAAGVVRITHPERIIDPGTGFTKRDLIAYYERVAPLMLPHLASRPVAMARAPDGVGGEVFFQKHLERAAIAGVASLDPALDPGHASLLEIRSVSGLIGAAQMNAVEFHTWNARKDRIERPDRITLDLDPGEGLDWQSMQQAAHLLRTLLGELKLPAFLKTSGGKGLHVVCPIRRTHDWDAVKQLAKRMSGHLATTFPDRFVAISGPRRRAGKIFIDYLRNGRGATTVSAWSVRLRPGLGVSVPIGWEELDGISGGGHWTLANIGERLAVGDAPWRGYDKAAAGIGTALRTLVAN